MSDRTSDLLVKYIGLVLMSLYSIAVFTLPYVFALWVTGGKPSFVSAWTTTFLSILLFGGGLTLYPIVRHEIVKFIKS